MSRFGFSVSCRKFVEHIGDAYLQSGEISQRRAEGGDPVTSTPAEYTADIDREEKKWGDLVRKLNLKVE